MGDGRRPQLPTPQEVISQGDEALVHAFAAQETALAAAAEAAIAVWVPPEGPVELDAMTAVSVMPRTGNAFPVQQ